MMNKAVLVISIVTSSICFANDSSFNFQAYIGENIHTYNMGYRLQNRIWQKQKTIARNTCQEISKDLMNHRLSKDFNFKELVVDYSVKVGLGKRASVQFACEFDLTLTNYSKDFYLDSVELSYESEDAALKGCFDYLSGLGENVILSQSRVSYIDSAYLCQASGLSIY